MSPILDRTVGRTMVHRNAPSQVVKPEIRCIMVQRDG